MDSVNKDPDATLDYKRNWGPWLADADDDTIVTSTWIVPDGLTKDSESNDTTTATVWLSGGTAGLSYDVVNRITTAQGRTDDRTLIIMCRQR
jgi:hypothetical protein